MAGVFRVHSWSLACLCQAQTLRCLDLHLAAGDWGQNAEGWRVYTKIPPFFAATTHDRRYPKWWVEANTNGFFWSCMWFTCVSNQFPSTEASSFLPLWPSIVARRAWLASTFGEKWRSWTGSRRQPPTSAALNGVITVPIFFSKKDWKIQGFKLKERTFQLIGHATWSFAHLHYIYNIYI